MFVKFRLWLIQVMINHVSATRPLQQQSERGIAYPDDSYYVFSLSSLLRMQFIYTEPLQLIKTKLQTAGSVWSSSIHIMLRKTSSRGHAGVNGTTICVAVCCTDILFDLNTGEFSSHSLYITLYLRRRRKKANCTFHWLFFFSSLISNHLPPSFPGTFGILHLYYVPLAASVWDFLILTSSTKESHLQGPMG